MPRLSELLERLRPAGTPGAPNEGERQRTEEAREWEIAAVVSMLHRHESDADEMIAAARAEVDRLRGEGDRRARAVRARLPERIAVAHADAARQEDEHRDREIERITRETDAEIVRLRADAETRIPRVAEAVVAAIMAEHRAPRGAP